MAKVSLKVGPRDIKLGQPYEGESCPIARAAKRVVRKNVHVDVSGGYLDLYLVSKDGEYSNTATVLLGDVALDFVTKFDDGLPVEPISLRPSIPARFLKPSFLKAKKTAKKASKKTAKKSK